MAHMIWWLTQANCEAIGSNPTGLPGYIFTEYRSRLGRPARGRLWVSAEIEWKGDATWLFTGTLASLLENAGGIVVRAEDVHHLATLPGILTAADPLP